MTSLSEQALFWLARRLYSTEVAHSDEMKEAVSNRDCHQTYRSAQLGRILEAAERYGVALEGRDVLDLGCNDGALSVAYPDHGAATVVGVDIDEAALELARQRHGHPRVDYRLGTVASMPVDEESIDVIICFDVFEHVSRPGEMLRECYRVLRPGGSMLIGTWGWGHPFAPHLWHTMPVPWAHVVFSEKTVLRVSRRVYESPWYVPNMHDFDSNGDRRQDKYLEESISTEYLNKHFVRDFEEAFERSEFDYRVHLEPFGSRWARWTRPLLGMKPLREYVHSYLWAVLRRPRNGPENGGGS